MKNSNLKYLEATVQPILAEESKDGTLAKFKILANAGSRMSFWDGDLVIDLAGEFSQKDARAIPILYGHDWDAQLGHATVSRADDRGLWLEGVVSVPSKRAQEWIQSAKNGFPWQASLGFVVERGTAVGKNEEVEVNGRVEKGELTVANKIQIWECSVVTFGADDKTQADVEASARFRKDDTMSNKDEKEKEASELEKERVQASAEELKQAKADAEKAIEELRAARVAENKRIDALEGLAKKYGDRSFLEAAINEGWDADRFELETLRHARSQAPSPTAPPSVDPVKVCAAAFMRRAGRRLDKPTKRFTQAELEAADRLRGCDMRGIFEAATGFEPKESQRLDVGEWFYAASLSTNSLIDVLKVTGNAVLEEEFGVFERRWEPLFKRSVVDDFKKAPRYRLESSMEFEEIPDGAEFPNGTQTEEGWDIQAKTYGKQYSIGRKALINGEALGVFNDILKKLAFGATQKINRDCWSLLMNPGNASDGTAFYHANHGSLLTGKALSLANLDAALASFATRTRKTDDTPLGIEAKYLVVPPALVGTARNILNSTEIESTSYEGKTNPMKNIVEVVSAPQLAFPTFTNYSGTTWYLFADPNAIPAFEVAYLFGVENPTVRSAEFDIGKLGIGFDGYFDYGIALRDYRAALKVTA